MSEFKIKTPFLGKKKENIIRDNRNSFPLYLTYSCVKDVKGKHCGSCIKCKERKGAFEKLKIEDKTEYARRA